MRTYHQERGDRYEQAERAGAQGAPGKRTLTQGLAPRPREAAGAAERAAGLEEAVLRRARRKNPRWQRRLHFDPAAWSSAPVGSAAFAADVAAAQRRLGVRVDGIVGPETLAAADGQGAEGAGGADGADGADDGGGLAMAELGEAAPGQYDPSARYDESRLTFDPPAASGAGDPFGLHLIGHEGSDRIDL